MIIYIVLVSGTWPLLSDHSPKCLLSVIKQNNFLVLSGGRSKILMGSIQQEVCGAAGAGGRKIVQQINTKSLWTFLLFSHKLF